MRFINSRTEIYYDKGKGFGYYEITFENSINNNDDDDDDDFDNKGTFYMIVQFVL